MYYVDTHAHLFLKEFENDLEKVISDSISAKVKKIILPNVDVSTIEKMLKVAKNYSENCFALLGLHPTSVKEHFNKDLEIIENLLKNEQIFGIGEIGLDLYWDKTHFSQQLIALETQLSWAKTLNLPVSIHIRNAWDETLQFLTKFNRNNLRGVFHAFSGTLEQAKKVIDWNFKIGIGGVVTFPNAKLTKIVENLDINNIVLETDCPYLTPVPKKGLRNEPQFIPYIAKKIAEIKHISEQEVAEITTKNAENLFNIF